MVGHLILALEEGRSLTASDVNRTASLIPEIDRNASVAQTSQFAQHNSAVDSHAARVISDGRAVIIVRGAQAFVTQMRHRLEPLAQTVNVIAVVAHWQSRNLTFIYTYREKAHFRLHIRQRECKWKLPQISFDRQRSVTFSKTEIQVVGSGWAGSQSSPQSSKSSGHSAMAQLNVVVTPIFVHRHAFKYFGESFSSTLSDTLYCLSLKWHTVASSLAKSGQLNLHDVMTHTSQINLWFETWPTCRSSQSATH